MLAADLRLGLGPVAFAREALGFQPDPWQTGVLQWPGKRLLLNCSRQSGKSTTAAILAQLACVELGECLGTERVFSTQVFVNVGGMSNS